MEVILTVEHLRRHFSAEPVLVNVGFTLRAGDKVGLIDPNGYGKTTLLNILASREESGKGNIGKASECHAVLLRPSYSPFQKICDV